MSPLSCLFDVVTDQGVVGHGIVFTYTVAVLKPTAELVQNLAPLVEREALAPVAIEQNLASRFRLLGTQGLVGMALAGIDMALWDALARVHNISLVSLLGGSTRPVPAYGAIGYDGEMESAKAAEDWVRRGLNGVKAKIGYATVAEDLAVIRAIRSAVGRDVAIMVDYNQSLTPGDAVERLRQLEDEGLTWIEEPTLAHDYQGHAHIAHEIRTPIQCGENWWGVRDMQHAIQASASDFMMPDVMKIGGVTGWMRAAALGRFTAFGFRTICGRTLARNCFARHPRRIGWSMPIDGMRWSRNPSEEGNGAPKGSSRIGRRVERGGSEPLRSVAGPNITPAALPDAIAIC